MNDSPKMRVRDFMVPKPVVFTEDSDLLESARVLVARKISGAPVVDAKGTLVGVLTERDLLQAAMVARYHDEGGGRVAEHMSRDVQVVSVDDTLFEVAERFVGGKYRRFPVIEDNRVVGLVTRRDVLRVVLGSRI
ncbi:MAG: CBS domain-containing protein [Polyangiales bacterium]